MTFPYEAPRSALIATGPGKLIDLSWKRVLVFVLLIKLSVNLIAFFSALTSGLWMVFGFDAEAAVVNARLMSKVLIFLANVVLFWLLASPVRRPFAAILIVVLVVELVGVAFEVLIYRTPLDQLFEAAGTARFLAAAFMGWVAARFRPINPMKWTDSAPSD